MEQTERILKLADEFKTNLKEMHGEYETSVETIDGRDRVILTNSKGERHVLALMFGGDNIQLVSVPEKTIRGELTGLTKLEKKYIETAAERTVFNLQSRISKKIGWDLTAFTAIFHKQNETFILEWEDGTTSITEGELNYPSEDDE